MSLYLKLSGSLANATRQEKEVKIKKVWNCLCLQMSWWFTNNITKIQKQKKKPPGTKWL